MNKPLLTLLAASALAVAAPAFAANPTGEIKMAATHADLAVKATELSQVRMHLHHALNCLVGPHGKDYDNTNANPCAGMGDGAIPDSTYPGTVKNLKEAAKQAMAGIAANDLAKAHKRAIDMASSIDKVKN